jgi:hypothetical protein
MKICIIATAALYFSSAEFETPIVHFKNCPILMNSNQISSGFFEIRIPVVCTFFFFIYLIYLDNSLQCPYKSYSYIQFFT